MFTLQQVGPPPGKSRLLSAEKLTPADFDKLARSLAVMPSKARKVGFISARRASEAQKVTTRWNGKESTATAEPGDMIVANMSVDRQILRDAGSNANVYVISAARFPILYERDRGVNEFGDIYRARGRVEALFLSGGFEIMTPWGEMQNADAGFILRNGEEIYGNNKETFEMTYRVE